MDLLKKLFFLIHKLEAFSIKNEVFINVYFYFFKSNFLKLAIFFENINQSKNN